MRMIADGQRLVEDGPFSANEFKQRELGLVSVIVDTAVEAETVLGVAKETGLDAIERRRSLPPVLLPDVDPADLAERREVAGSCCERGINKMISFNGRM
jgi:hypothetical protein